MKVKWYQKTWAKILLSILVISVSSVLFFLFLVFRQVSKLNNGDLTVIPNFNKQQYQVPTRDQYDLSVSNKKVASVVESHTSPMSGNSNAQITVVEFADYRCGFCRQLHPTLRRLAVEYNDRVRFIYRDYPILGDDSYVLALAARCADEQGKFLQFHDKVFSHQILIDEILAMSETIGLNTGQMEQCINSKKYDGQIQKDLSDGLTAGVTGTPTLFINGHMVSGAPSYDILKKVFDTTLTHLK